MGTKNKYILGAAVFFLTIYFVAIPLINRQKASATAKTIFNHWLKDDPAAAISYFLDVNKSPPIYDLKSYEIKKVKFEKVNGRLLARFYVVLNFPMNNPLPSGRVWVCELEKLSRYWRASDFYLSQE